MAVLCVVALPSCVLAQAAMKPAQAAPTTLDDVRKQMGIASQGDVRGQMDIIGFASTVCLCVPRILVAGGAEVVTGFDRPGAGEWWDS